MERFKKGQIVTKRTGLVKANKAKMLHLCAFGEDVIVDGKRITVLGEGPAICINRGYIGGKKGKPKEYGIFLIEGLHIELANRAV